MQGFWGKLPHPFFIQAPMEDVTDVAFRRLIVRFGKPDVMFMEFTSADGLVLADERGQKILRKKLMYSENERPVVAQLFSAIPERMERAAMICAELGVDGIDINMGCPDRAVEKSGCGADLIKHPDRARAIIRAAQRGGKGLPVSVKTRIGYNKDELDTWLPELLAEKPANLTLHLRTRKEMSDVPAHWEVMPRALAIRDAMSPETLLTGNGDVKDLDDARAKAKEWGCDGIMLGRAIYGNPWLYRGFQHDGVTISIIEPRDRIKALAEHIRLFDELLGDTSNFATMKKHFKAYISGWDNAKELRMQLMETTNAEEALILLSSQK
ncbi:MAG: tRNA-dihydrouridine synthase [Patescibacteria group bacterium]